jgi:chromosome segregation ATPase
MRFFRSSVLLFHPDKSNGNEELSRIQTEFFPQFRQLSETSGEILKEGLEILKCYAPRSEAEIQKILDEIERDRQVFRAELAKIREEIAQMRKEREQAKSEMKAKIEQLERLMRAQNRSQNQPSEETAPQDQERPGGSTHFFARR